jgi:hypothetical protein
VWLSQATEEDFNETQRLLATIAGGQALLDWFGGVASFHDAEVVRLHLDRETSSRVELALLGPKGEARVTFVLTDWIDATVSGFSHQNVISELYLSEPGDRSVQAWERGVGMLSGDHLIVLEPIFGAYGTIRATISRIELAVRHHKSATRSET